MSNVTRINFFEVARAAFFLNNASPKQMLARGKRYYEKAQ